MTKIGIDARFFGPKQKGLGRYVQRLIEELAKSQISNLKSQNCEFVVFLRKENFDDFEPSTQNFKKVLANWRWYTIREQIFMPWIIWRNKIGLMHFPHFNVPVFCPTKFVVTIHDLVLKKFPTKRATTLHPVFYKIKEWGYRLVLGWAVTKSQKIIVPSNFTKHEIIEYFKINPQKIEVIYEGAPACNALPARMTCVSVSGGRSNAGRPQTANHKNPVSDTEIFKKYKIRKPYILYVGNAYPHKNLEGLVAAFKKICHFKYGYGVQLVLVGGRDYFYEKLISAIKHPIPDWIVFASFVPDGDLPELYKNALLYVSPAFSEGFGLPPLEAMSYGVPVVASSGGAQPEILGEAAFYFDPENIDDMVEKISALLKDEKLRNDLMARGKEQIKKYNWQDMAKKTLEIYKEVLRI